MKALSLLLVGLTPNLLASGAPNEVPACESLSEMFSSSFENPKDLHLRSRLLDHLRKCPAREGDLPVEFAPGLIISTQKEEPMPVYPLYVAVKNKAEDVAEALLERGNIKMNLTQDPVDYYGTWGPNVGVGFLYFNPVWAAIDNQQFDLALRIIKSPHISVHEYFEKNSKTNNTVPIPSPSFFIPHVITFFCNSDKAQKNEDAMKFCVKLITEFPKNSFKLASCDGLADHPSWAWSILQKRHLDFEAMQQDNLMLAWKFPYAGKYPIPDTRYDSNTCGVMHCDCAVEAGIDYALQQKNLSPESEMVALSWLKSLSNDKYYGELRRSLLRSLMVNKRYPQVLRILQEQPKLSSKGQYILYGAPKGFQKKWFENGYYKEALLLDAFFYGNDQIIQHFLNNSDYSPDFLKQLVEIGETSGKSLLGNLFGSGLQVPKDNLLIIKSFIISSR